MMMQQKIYILIVVLFICIYTCDKIYTCACTLSSCPSPHPKVHLKLVKSMVCTQYQCPSFGEDVNSEKKLRVHRPLLNHYCNFQ